jgi:flagellar M-ring protein FliF
MGGLLTKFKVWWETADRTQRAVTLFGSAFLVLLLGGVFYFSTRPHMSLVFDGLDSAEVGMVTDEIQKLGIPVEYDVNGNVQVPIDKVAEVRAKLAEAGKLPSPGHQGSDSLDKIGPTTTNTVEAARMKQIEQDQLNTEIEDIKGVARATVQVNLGDRSPFADETKPATASVEVALQPNAMLSPDQGRAIAMLVANAVTGLSPDNVFVVDNTGHTLYDASHGGSDNANGNEKIQTEIAEKTRRQRELQEALDSTFGRGNTLVEVNLELNYDKTATTEDTHKPNKKPEQAQTNTESMSGDGANAGGLAGLSSNSTTPRAAPTPAGGGKNYTNSNNTYVYPVDEKQTSTQEALGGLKSMSIAALVNTKPVGADGKPTTINKQDVQDFLDAYLKPWSNADKSHFVASVTQAPFDMSAQAVAAQAQKAEAARDRMQQMISMLPIAALLFVGLMVAKAITKAAKPQLLAALPGGGTLALDAPDGEHFEGDEGHMLHFDGEPGDEHDGGEHAPAIEEITLIQEKLNLPLEQLKRMSDEKSENVAMLIKSWIMEDHK